MLQERGSDITLTEVVSVGAMIVHAASFRGETRLNDTIVFRPERSIQFVRDEIIVDKALPSDWYAEDVELVFSGKVLHLSRSDGCRAAVFTVVAVFRRVVAL